MSTRIGEPKPADGYTVRAVKRDRRLVGELHSYKDPKVNVFWAFRRTDGYSRSDESWGIEVDVLSAVRAYGVTHVGVRVEDGTRMLARISLFGIDGKERGVVVKHSTRTTPAQWRVPERLWAIKKPPEDTRDDALIERMKIAGRRR